MSTPAAAAAATSATPSSSQTASSTSSGISPVRATASTCSRKMRDEADGNCMSSKRVFGLTLANASSTSALGSAASSSAGSPALSANASVCRSRASCGMEIQGLTSTSLGTRAGAVRAAAAATNAPKPCAKSVADPTFSASRTAKTSAASSLGSLPPVPVLLPAPRWSAYTTSYASSSPPAMSRNEAAL